MYSDLVLGLLLVRSAMHPHPDSLPEEASLPPIDFAALRSLSGRAPAGQPVPGAEEATEPLRKAA